MNIKSLCLFVKVTVLGFTLPSFLYSSSSYAQQNINLDSPRIEITNEPVNISDSFDFNSINNATSTLLMDTAQDSQNIHTNQAYIDPEIIINLGKMIWDLIISGKPVVDIKTDLANALPEGVSSWQAISGWQTPVAKPFELNIKIDGISTLKFNYSVLYTYGGNWNGIGQYLSYVTILPGDVQVSWGNQFSAQVNVSKILNVGTSANPIAAVELILRWKVSNLFTHKEGSSTFYVTGAGDFRQLTQLW